MANIMCNIFDKATHRDFWDWLESDIRTPFVPKDTEDAEGGIVLRAPLSDVSDLITAEPKDGVVARVFGIWNRPRRLYLPVDNFRSVVPGSAVQDFPFSDISELHEAVTGLAVEIIVQRVNAAPVPAVSTDKASNTEREILRRQYIRSSRFGEPDGTLKSADLGVLPRMSWTDYAEALESTEAYAALAEKRAEEYLSRPEPYWAKTEPERTAWDKLLQSRAAAVRNAQLYAVLTQDPSPEWAAAKAVWEALRGLEVKTVRVMFFLDGAETEVTCERRDIMRQLEHRGSVMLQTSGPGRRSCDVMPAEIVRMTYRGKAVYARSASEKTA